MTSVVLYSLTRATLMSPGKDETRVYGYIRSEFIHCVLFVHHTTSILAKLSTRCFEHSGGISCSLLVNPSRTDESWEGRNTCLWIYIYIYIYIYIHIITYNNLIGLFFCKCQQMLAQRQDCSEFCLQLAWTVNYDLRDHF